MMTKITTDTTYWHNKPPAVRVYTKTRSKSSQMKIWWPQSISLVFHRPPTLRLNYPSTALCRWKTTWATMKQLSSGRGISLNLKLLRLIKSPWNSSATPFRLSTPSRSSSNASKLKLTSKQNNFYRISMKTSHLNARLTRNTYLSTHLNCSLGLEGWSKLWLVC